ncbi:MAG: UbiA family prenyltransferase [Candidatus Eisenbacteria bacterium]|nr:UbiA family prenyltransferase [Candidatus Eisenbacteria bacterium]
MTENRYRLLSFGFLKSYVVTMRPYLLFVSGAAGMVGLAFIESPQLWRVALAFVALFFSYGLGQALTDCFQTDTDAISAPYRPLVRGVVSKTQVFWVSLVGLTVVVLILAYLNPWILPLGFLAVIGLLTYTHFKRRWWGGPPWNAWIVAILPMMGRLVDRNYSLGELIRFGDLRTPAFCLSVIAIFAGYANFVVMGYFKDISADRETGYRTFPVAFGWRANAVYGDVTALVVAGLTAWVVALTGGGFPAWVVLAAAVALQLHAQVSVHRTRDEHAVGTPIANGVRALIFFCLAIVLALKPGWIGPAGIFYMAFELTLRLRPERGQV